MNLESASLILVYGAMAAYTIAMVAFAIDFSSADKAGTRKAANIGMSVTTLAFALHLLGTITRGVAASRVPWANMYEFTLTFTCVAVAAYLVLARDRDLRVLGTFVSGLALLSLGVAVAVLYVRVQGTPPILDNYWLVIHVSTATLAMGLFAFAALMSVLQLVQLRSEARETAAVGAGGTAVVEESKSRWRSLPGADELEQGAFRITVIGFLLWTFTLIAGAIWAEHAWGRPWNWDPKETMSLVVWGFYGAYLHARATRGWEGKRAAWLNVIGIIALFINYVVVNFFADSMHSYAGV
ncbi:c-type cytochrome biogenesis protein CcsB [Flaviflexus equikiangi]|uniref:c-type cytochrome biogenesis protein CcsB n=1 Tax=Flaviflexus equikiangi TaxID=2758573 RepID=UPI0015F6AA82|nr:c-type cytochrome biogenesis protein CcsB [Flaviflexus equikiangi]